VELHDPVHDRVPRPAGLRAPPAALCTQLLRVIDLLAVLPTWLAVLVPGLHVLIDVRILRPLKLTECMAEFGVLYRAVSGHDAGSWCSSASSR
jgi:hypothetical protein